MGRGEGPLGVNVQAGGVELTQGGRIPPPASCTTREEGEHYYTSSERIGQNEGVHMCL